MTSRLATGADHLTFDPSGPHRLSVKPEAPTPDVVGGYLRVVKHDAVGGRYMSLTLESPTIAATTLPGQFVMLTVASAGEAVPPLPRPMAIYSTDADRGIFSVVYAVIGRGTRKLSEVGVGESIYVAGPLGRGFDIPAGSRSVLLVGRGIGTCSLTTVAQHNQRHGLTTFAVTSARTAAALVGVDFYREQGASMVLAVDDQQGTSHPDDLSTSLTDRLDDRAPDLIMTCGSTRLAIMCQELGQRWDSTVQVSLEAHMACGIGYCHGCASGAPSELVETPLVCKVGPVFALDMVGGDGPGPR